MTSPNTCELENELKRSDKCLQAAKILIENQLYNDAISRIYYAMFHAAKAALLSKGILTKSHESTIMFFGKTFVQTGEIEGEYGRMLNRAWNFRQKGDYDAYFDFEKEETSDRYEEAVRFCSKIKEILGK